MRHSLLASPLHEVSRRLPARRKTVRGIFESDQLHPHSLVGDCRSSSAQRHLLRPFIPAAAGCAGEGGGSNGRSRPARPNPEGLPLDQPGPHGLN